MNRTHNVHKDCMIKSWAESSFVFTFVHSLLVCHDPSRIIDRQKAISYSVWHVWFAHQPSGVAARFAVAQGVCQLANPYIVKTDGLGPSNGSCRQYTHGSYRFAGGRQILELLRQVPPMLLSSIRRSSCSDIAGVEWWGVNRTFHYYNESCKASQR